ncbi:MAG: hypothetical protein AB1449_04205 [Chloroflexota bacterium]
MTLLRSAATFVSDAYRTSLASARELELPLPLIALNQVMNIGATTCFAFSGRAASWRQFIIWQVVGSAFGLGTQLTFAGMARLGSVRMASAVGIGLAFVSAELVSAYLIFRESFSRGQWAGVGLVFVGLVMISAGKP